MSAYDKYQHVFFKVVEIKFPIYITEPIPRIVSPQNVTVEAGGIAVLRCVVDNLGFRTVSTYVPTRHTHTRGAYRADSMINIV